MGGFFQKRVPTLPLTYENIVINSAGKIEGNYEDFVQNILLTPNTDSNETRILDWLIWMEWKRQRDTDVVSPFINLIKAMKEGPKK